MTPFPRVAPARQNAVRRWPHAAATATALAVSLALAGCSAGTETASGTESVAFFDDSQVHDIHVEFNDEDYQQMLATYTESGDKDWISATVTVDGTTLQNVGLRLKGNSSLMSLKGGGPGGAEAGGTTPDAAKGTETDDAGTDAGADDAGGDADAGAGDTGTGTGTDTEGSTGTTDAETDGGADGGADGAGDEDPADSGDGDGSAESPESLPWLIRTDKFVDGQEYQGRTDLVVRGNNSESSLNEAVALELIGAAGLATLEASETRFSVNDSAQELRLVIESPDDEAWNEDTFGTDGSTYKAESTGDYTYRGENGDDYQDAFEQKAGDEADLQPVAEFLDFVNNSSDEEFGAQLGEHLDVDAFARYLAVQELLGNMDDIDGPGNNSYLRYDADSGKMTVVTWDMNLAFGSMPGGGGGFGVPGEGMPEGMEPPEGMPEGFERPEGLPEGIQLPEGMQPPANGDTDANGPGGNGAGGGMPGGAENPLTTRFHNDAGFQAQYESALEELQADLYDSGTAQEILDRWSALLTEQATDLVSPETVAKEADSISGFFSGSGEEAELPS